MSMTVVVSALFDKEVGILAGPVIYEEVTVQSLHTNLLVFVRDREPEESEKMSTVADVPPVMVEHIRKCLVHRRVGLLLKVHESGELSIYGAQFAIFPHLGLPVFQVEEWAPEVVRGRYTSGVRSYEHCYSAAVMDQIATMRKNDVKEVRLVVNLNNEITAVYPV